jgi:hypothetical protein
MQNLGLKMNDTSLKHWDYLEVGTSGRAKGEGKGVVVKVIEALNTRV